MADQRVIDRGLYWEIVYPDGSDTIPKDPVQIDMAATLAESHGDTGMASRLRTYAKQIRESGYPSPIGGFGAQIVLVVILAILLIAVLTKKER